MFSLKLKVPLIVVSAMILFTAGLLYVDYQGKLELIELNKQSTLEGLVKQFHSEVELTTQGAEARAELVANVKEIKTLFRKGVDAIDNPAPAKVEAAPAKVEEAPAPAKKPKRGKKPAEEEEAPAVAEAPEAAPPVETVEALRQRLIDELNDTRQIQEARYGVVQAQFHRAPALSYYRLHDPKKWNDDLKSFRFTVLDANAQNKAVSGPELGRGGLGIRAVVPVNDEKGQIGTFEFGMQFKPILERLKASHKAEISLLLDASLQKNITWEKWRDEAGVDIGNFKHVFSTDAARLASLLDAETLSGATEQRLFSRISSKREFGVILSPLKDFSGKRIGVIAIARDFSEFTQIVDASTRNALILFLVGVLVLTILVFLVLNLTILSPIATITKAADRVSLGDLESQMQIKGEDEIGQLTASFERMRISLSKAMSALEEE
ncbi:HAMP domain-containing protein [Myxococcota bacterium]|nr:HAMP domain-containing protein [Myxococcota bacterium]